MLAAAAPISLPFDAGDAIDIVGTGGAPSRRVHALNVSTMSCFVAAGAGAKVCKHGNRKASSTSGSSDEPSSEASATSTRLHVERIIPSRKPGRLFSA